MTIWYASDHHFYHENIIKYCSRPFDNANQMNEALVAYHNELVKPEDHVWFLGDVTMLRDNRGSGLEILNRVNGHKRLIMGNHDHYKMPLYLKWFEKVQAMHMHDNIRFTHIPVHPTSMGRAIANVHGHTHDHPNEPPVIHVGDDGRVRYQPYINISLERTNYRPVSLDQVKTLINREKGEYEGVKV